MHSDSLAPVARSRTSQLVRFQDEHLSMTKTSTYDKNTLKHDLSESNFDSAFFLRYRYFYHAVSRHTEQLGDLPQVTQRARG